MTHGDNHLILGLLIICYCLFAIILLPIFYIESPVNLIKNGNTNDAVLSMMKLRNESSETWDIKNDLEEIKLMIDEDTKLTSKSIISDGNLRPLLLVTLSSLIYFLSFNYPLNYIRLYFLQDYRFNGKSGIYFLIIRLTIGLIFIILFDKIQRKTIQLITAIGCGSILIIFGIIYSINDNITLWIRLTFFLIYEIIASIGIGSIPDVLTSEAYPIQKKIQSITFTTIFINFLNILTFLLTFNINLNLNFILSILFSFGIVIILIGLFLYKNLPETRLMSLRQSRAEFRKVGDTLYSGNNKPAGIVYS